MIHLAPCVNIVNVILLEVQYQCQYLLDYERGHGNLDQK